MKKLIATKSRQWSTTIVLIGLVVINASMCYGQVSDAERKSIATHDKVVTTQLGTLNFKDGVPDAATTQKLYDELDYMNGDIPYLELPSTGSDMHNRSGRAYTISRFKGPSFAYGESEYRFPISPNKLKNTKISSINATSRSFRIETIDGREVQGYLTRSEKPGILVINAIDESEEIRLDEIANLVYYGKTLLSRITGNVSSGFTYTKSSRIGRLNVDGLIKYNTKRGQTTLDGDMIITYDNVEEEAERANLTVSHEHTFAPLWAIVILLKYQRNVERIRDLSYLVDKILLLIPDFS